MESEQTSKQITELAKRFKGLQTTLRLNDRAFAARFSKHLVSEKAWIAIKENRWQGFLKPETALARLQAMANQLDASSTFVADDFFKTLPFVKLMNAEYERLLGSTRDRRCLVCLAPEGVGKSWWTSSIVTANPENCVYLRLSHTWHNKTYPIAVALAAKFGLEPEKNPANQVGAVQNILKARPETVLFFDEGHNGGVALMKLIKDLIDETPVRVVYQAFPQQFDQVRTSSAGSIFEARQFLRRCLRPVFDDYRTGIGPKDVVAFLAAHGIPNNGELKLAAEALTPTLVANFNLSGLDDAVDEARKEADDEGVPLTLDMVTRSIDELCSTAEQRAKSAAQATRKAA